MIDWGCPLLKELTSLKILILMSYYNRPLLVRNTLNSILKANEHHNNWHLAFGDDGSKIPGRPIVEEMLKDHMHKVTIVETQMTFEEKIKEGISLGRYANAVIKESDADVGIMLCDDDELHPEYLKNLSQYFLSRPDVLYCYSKIHLFNPFIQTTEGVNNISGKFNQWNTPINPVGKVDATQVAWRLSCCKERGAWFKESTRHVEGKPWTRDTDRGFFETLSEKCGLCHPTGFVGQYKGVHDYQLLWHKNVPAAALWSYDQMCRDLGGVEF